MSIKKSLSLHGRAVQHILLSDAFFQNLMVKKIITAVSSIAIIINSGRLGAMSGSEEVNILYVSLMAPKEISIKSTASAFHLFMSSIYKL